MSSMISPSPVDFSQVCPSPIPSPSCCSSVCSNLEDFPFPFSRTDRGALYHRLERPSVTMVPFADLLIPKNVQGMWAAMRADPHFCSPYLPLDRQGLENAEEISVRADEFERVFGSQFVEVLEVYFRFLAEAISERPHPHVQKLSLTGMSWSSSHRDDVKKTFIIFLQRVSWVQLPSLTALFFRKAVTAGGIECIVKSFEQGHLPRLSSLEFLRNSVADEGCQALMKAARSSCLQRLEVLRFGDEELTQDGVVSLGRALGAGCFPELARLELSGNAIGDAGAEALAVGLRSGRVKSLIYLSINNDESMQQAGVAALAGALQVGSAPRLKEFTCTLSSCADPIEKEGAEAMAKAVESGFMSKVETLDLFNFKAGALVIDGLARGDFSGLKHLWLSSFSLGREAATVIAEQLARGRWPSLEDLELSGNHLGDEGVAALAVALAAGHVHKLQRLGLQENEIHDAGALAIGNLLVQESVRLPRLECVDLSGNEIGEMGASALVNAYRKNALLIAELEVQWPRPERSRWKQNYEGCRNSNLWALRIPRD